MPNFPPEHVSLITGASTGIGAASARAMAAAGSRVVVHYNSSREAADAVVQEIHDAGGTAWLFQADLRKPEPSRQLVADVLAECGRIDCLVNNAGALIAREKFLDITPELWESVLDVNLNQVLWVSQPVAAHMKDRGSGAIINMASIAGRNGGGIGAIPYATSKGALTTMTKGMAKELIQYGIRVNAIHPGVILTPFHERFTPEDRMKAMVATIPQGRAGVPDEIAHSVVFLAGDGSKHIVGEALEINGGMLMD